MDKTVWFRYFWDDGDGVVPTPECDFWDYQYVITEEGKEQEGVQNFVDRQIRTHYMCSFRERLITWEIIDRPPQSFIDDRIKWAKESIINGQLSLQFWESI